MNDSKAKKMRTAELKLQKIMNKINSSNLSKWYISRLPLPSSVGSCGRLKRFRDAMCTVRGFIVVVLTAIITAHWIHSQISSKSCHLALPSASRAAFRPPSPCEACSGVLDVHRVANITPQLFEEQYAYTMQPVIVTDAMHGWRAVEEFNFNFFKQFYSEGISGTQINECFYFAYKSGLNSLSEVFSMTESRANLSGEPWYVGWSTCMDEEMRRLRQYYSRPYFLPATAESDMVDWLFMGGPGQGAHMHVDSVRHMSWQAQVRGRKRWQLAPPPECLYHCSWITFDVQPGEILVVDTNRWYHRTTVLPGDISITIGAEYD